MAITVVEGGWLIDHAPSANLDYGFNWAKWLLAGETISTATWTADTGITLSNPLQNGSVVSTFAEGGEAGKSYKLLCSIVTDQGREDSRTIILNCVQR